jgi:hypothetical protein
MSSNASSLTDKADSSVDVLVSRIHLAINLIEMFPDNHGHCIELYRLVSCSVPLLKRTSYRLACIDGPGLRITGSLSRNLASQPDFIVESTKDIFLQKELMLYDVLTRYHYSMSGSIRQLNEFRCDAWDDDLETFFPVSQVIRIGEYH